MGGERGGHQIPTMKPLVLRSLVGVMACWACSSDPAGPDSSPNDGAGGRDGQAGGNSAGQAGTPSMAGMPPGGASGDGATGGGAGRAGSTMGGNAGNAAVAGSAGQAGQAGSNGIAAGCANHDYDLCLDFEVPIDQLKWTGGTEGAITTADFAHGQRSYRLYPNGGGLLKATDLGKISNQMWGRFYVHFKPGAPGGHGNIVGAFDQSNNWYEMGWQFDAMMGVWHAENDAERPLRSKPFIVDQWYCVELFFDGTKTEMPKWWIDGKEAEYYMAANEQLIPKVVTQFDRVEVGFTPYAGLGLQMPDGKGPPDDRVLTDMAIDDIAFDTERIGCISP
jgi:hypothetical protein